MLSRPVSPFSIVNPMDNQPMRLTTQLAFIFRLNVMGPDNLATSRSK